jgi:outer membrane lipoprotein-sorting protein
MRMWLVIALLAWAAQALASESGQPRIEDGTTDARAIVAGAIDLQRGRTSYAEMTMVVHRPEWQRSSSLVAWTRGREDALIRFTAPAKDAGNATLKQGDKMWTFAPKLNRTIRLPFSLMSTSWAGSDFSYNDLSRTDQLLHHYTLTLEEVDATADGHTTYRIAAVPTDDAPVVWGKEELVIRDDYVLLAQTYYDQELTPLKRMEALEIRAMGGRVIPARLRMNDLEKSDHYTEITYDAAEFDIDVDDQLFTLFSLQSGARG